MSVDRMTLDRRLSGSKLLQEILSQTALQFSKEVIDDSLDSRC